MKQISRSILYYPDTTDDALLMWERFSWHWFNFPNTDFKPLNIMKFKHIIIWEE